MVTPASPAPSIGHTLAAALEATQRLLTGSRRGHRWKALFVLAAMAGLVGVGAAPPPLGLLQPLWADPTLHHTLFDNPSLIASLVFLALFLLLMGGFGRSFTLGFLYGLATGNPEPGSYRASVRAGVKHFVWSSALSIPLYALLFGGEALVAHDTITQITQQLGSATGTDAELIALLLQAALKFLLVLVPWTVVTLPLMVTVYELTPATMVLKQLPPGRAFRHVLATAGKRPGSFAGYFGVRFVLQFLGNLVALVALIPSLLISSPVVVTLAGGGWQLSRQLGGLSTPGGAAVLTVSVLFAAIALYCALCAALLPVSVFVNFLALEWMRQFEPGFGTSLTGSVTGDVATV